MGDALDQFQLQKMAVQAMKDANAVIDNVKENQDKMAEITGLMTEDWSGAGDITNDSDLNAELDALMAQGDEDDALEAAEGLPTVPLDIPSAPTANPNQQQV